MARILIVDDDAEALRHAAAAACSLGHVVVTAAGGEAALALLRNDRLLEAVLLDLVMPDLDGMAVLDAIKRDHAGLPAIVMAPPDAASAALRAGAVDFVEKPVGSVRLGLALSNALRLAELEAQFRRAPADGTADFITTGPAMARLRASLPKFARSSLPLLIEGEPGTGREHFARQVHAAGPRRAKPFVICDGEPDDLDACLLRAKGGTLFVREIGRLSPTMQRTLLGFLETGAIRQPGAARPTRLEVRLIASSAVRLVDLARAGEIEPRLFDRLNVLPAFLPPLRERREDIPFLARRFLIRHAAGMGRRITDISPAAMQLLAAHDWPGNLRGLERAVRCAVALAASAGLEPIDFPELLAARDGRDGLAEAVRIPTPVSEPVQLERVTPAYKQTEGAGAAPDRFLTAAGEVVGLAEIERELILFALGRHGAHMTRLARTLGIGRSTLYRKLRELGLDGGAMDSAAGEPATAARKRAGVG
ncbi:MAG TPA: sigma 54-interacting transcriptional regulator [Devosia sp.]|nr:sigma 54-interacting transcriptional regulator [Devosia sp.]